MHYRTDKMLIVTFNQCSYDKVWINKNGKVEQGCQNIQSCTQETNTLEQILKRLDNNSTGEQNIFALGENTDTKKIQEVMDEIRKTVSESPDKNFLIVYILAGRGVQYNGKHMMLLNDFD